MRRLFFIIFVIFLFSGGVLYGTICANYSPCAYEGESSVKSTSGLNMLVVMGAGYFLESHSNYQTFLNKVELSELSGVNYDELRGILNNTIASMESAKENYYELKTLAEYTPYNQAVIACLKEFNYDEYLKERGDLNPKVFQEVKGFLVNGDVTGSYNAIYSKTVDILKILYRIKRDIDKNVLPDVSTVWQLNQKYSDTLFFGQYVAMVCQEHKKK